MTLKLTNMYNITVYSISVLKIPISLMGKVKRRQW